MYIYTHTHIYQKILAHFSRENVGHSNDLPIQMLIYIVYNFYSGFSDQLKINKILDFFPFYLKRENNFYLVITQSCMRFCMRYVFVFYSDIIRVLRALKNGQDTGKQESMRSFFSTITIVIHLHLIYSFCNIYFYFFLSHGPRYNTLYLSI